MTIKELSLKEKLERKVQSLGQDLININNRIKNLKVRINDLQQELAFNQGECTRISAAIESYNAVLDEIAKEPETPLSNTKIVNSRTSSKGKPALKSIPKTKD